MEKQIVLQVGTSSYEGKPYSYLFVLLNVNGVETQIKLKPGSKFEKDLLVNAIGKVSEIKK
ncbi:MAG: hypothetical protein QXW48_03915 [Thermoplasmata archaeon]